MTAAYGGTTDRPLVAVVTRVPMLCEALSAALKDLADVKGFAADQDDTIGLLRWLRPDAVVVDDDGDVTAAESFARESNSPIVRVSLQDGRLKLLRNGGWVESANGESSSEQLRNILVGGLFGSRGRST
jgi:hypothetical protein